MVFSNKWLLFFATVFLISGVGVLLTAKSSKDSLESKSSGRIRTLELNEHNTLTMFDEVRSKNSEAVANGIANLNNLGNKEPIYLLLDSPGGSVIAGAKVVSSIEASKRPVYTVCLTVCASMAAVIHSYGHKRLAMTRAILMYHNAYGGFQGEFPRIQSLFSTINRYVEKFEQNIVSRSKISKDTFANLRNSELWIDGEDALAKGLVDELVFVNTSALDFPDEFEEKKQEATTKPRTTFEVNM